MPRRRRPRPPRRPPAAVVAHETTETRAGTSWHVRHLTGATSAKTYTCPQCHRAIRPGTAHVVAWPVVKALLSADALEERRHWHRDCWQRLR